MPERRRPLLSDSDWTVWLRVIIVALVFALLVAAICYIAGLASGYYPCLEAGIEPRICIEQCTPLAPCW
jgi:hypothetical protein